MSIPAEAAWTLSPHVCTVCLGRIVQHGRTFRCSSCERTTEGPCTDICGCGLSKRRSASGSPVFRCTANPDRAAFPAAYVIIYGDQVMLPDAAA